MNRGFLRSAVLVWWTLFALWNGVFTEIPIKGHVGFSIILNGFTLPTLMWIVGALLTFLVAAQDWVGKK